MLCEQLRCEHKDNKNSCGLVAKCLCFGRIEIGCYLFNEQAHPAMPLNHISAASRSQATAIVNNGTTADIQIGKMFVHLNTS